MADLEFFYHKCYGDTTDLCIDNEEKKLFFKKI